MNQEFLSASTLGFRVYGVGYIGLVTGPSEQSWFYNCHIVFIWNRDRRFLVSNVLIW